jgi:acyl-CoA synthetase (AMP-forming)/AMP-acid ligase II
MPLIKSSLVYELLSQAQSKPEAFALGFLADNLKQQLTYEELIQKIAPISNYLNEHCKIGDRIVLCFAPGIEFVVAFYACLFSGMIAVPTMPPLNKETAHRFNKILENSNCSLVLTTDDLIKKFYRLGFLNILKKYSFTKPLHHLLNKVHHDIEIGNLDHRWVPIEKIPDSSKPLEIKETWEEPVFFQYTSGSTSHGKGVQISMKNLVTQFEHINYAINMNDFKITCATWLPPYHDMGLIGCILYPIYYKGTSIMMSPIDFLRTPFKFLQIISNYKAEGFSAPNFSFELLLKKVSDEQLESVDLHSLKWILNGAEVIRLDTLKKFSERFKLDLVKFFPVYGLAEATLLVSGRKNNEHPHIFHLDIDAYRKGYFKEAIDEAPYKEIVSNGELHPDSKIIFLVPETLQLCEEGQIGEICISNDCVTKGYWNEPSETEKALIRFNDITYLRTGDLGFLYKNELYITGRIKDLIIINGKNYYAHDFEVIVEMAHPDIRKGCVAAFELEGSLSEDFVIVAEVKDVNVDQNQLKQLINQTILQHFQIVPHDIVLIKPKTLLKTTSGKIRHLATKALYLQKELETI